MVNQFWNPSNGSVTHEERRIVHRGNAARSQGLGEAVASAGGTCPAREDIIKAATRAHDAVMPA